MINFPVIELIDRLAIADVKFKRTNGANAEELTWYMNQAIPLGMEDIEDLYTNLVSIHNQIWDLESELKTLAHNMHLQDKIFFLGRTEKVMQFLESIDVFILTSKYEGFGLVLLEAMDAGVPIVASKNSSIAEVLGIDFPGLCETGNSEAYAEKILDLRDPTYRRKILQIQEERLSIFKVEKMSNLITSVYGN